MRAWAAELALTHFHQGKESALWQFHVKEQLCDLPGTVRTERRCQQRAATAIWPVPDDGTVECWQMNLGDIRRSQTDSDAPSGSFPGQLGVCRTLHLEFSSV